MRHVTFNPGKSSELGGPVLPSLHRVTRAGLELKFFFSEWVVFLLYVTNFALFFFIHSLFFF